MDPIIVGLAGGTGSGKTTCAKTIGSVIVVDIAAKLGIDLTFLRISMDSYYRDRSDLTPIERTRVNYDELDAIEDPLLLEHLEALRSGQSVMRPVYCFNTHSRSHRTEAMHPTDIIVVEGLFPFCYDGLRDTFDLRLYLDTDLDTSLARRKRRDQNERGRMVEDIERQFEETVIPGHHLYVAPSARYAHLPLVWDGDVTDAVAQIQGRLEELVVRRAA
ncbi:uridine kinase [Candidatus Woesearchaeota archaeon]|jgi:uridine kinase|nr:uridine kinase [Candidatus Woesearchaeota archaeon]MBT3537549.1 uridine kinase [Candidatus Woesearchaeota archaeon]MBT4696853.1 uridine kinase [Candidatus Woesearchaeota archaeon]MBT7106141.1 uridine kinase [Candidatus Woesearchaeota archaeon]MBT7930961.1 uridine kinase [Candidatus Woesearchaeota archaeon]